MSQLQQTIFQQKRANIPDDEKSAQLALLDFLETLLPTVDEIVIKTPLQGKLDFSILSECKFDNIREIQLCPGQVTEIVHLPRTITTLHVGNNLLQSLADLPESLVVLDAPSNGFRRLDLSYLRHLKSAQVSDNELEELMLPVSIETVHCENNRLKVLDVNGLDNLRDLHCSGNPLLAIHNASSSVRIDMENNPVLEIEKRINKGKRSTSASSSSSLSNRGLPIPLYDAVHKYMEKKNQYETKLYAVLRKNADSMVNMKRSERRQHLRELRMRAPCIKCGRPVSTIFSNKNHVYRARCGDRKYPCELDVEIHREQCQDLIYSVGIVRDASEEIQQKLVELKMDSVFNYKSDKKVSDELETYKKELESDTLIYTSAKQDYDDLYLSEERKTKIDELRKEIFAINTRMQEILQTKRESMAGMSNRDLVLQDAIQLYVDELKPKQVELQQTMYEWMEFSWKLVQNHSRLSKRDYVLDDGKVVKYTW